LEIRANFRRESRLAAQAPSIRQLPDDNGIARRKEAGIFTGFPPKAEF
jgi:hypothetical protein